MTAQNRIIGRTPSSGEEVGGITYRNMSTAPAARIRRVVLDQPAKTTDLMYSHASSIVISDAEEAMMVTMKALRP
jgi:hypothetical protein